MDNAAEKRLNHIFIVILRELECYFLTVGYSSCINKRHGSKTWYETKKKHLKIMLTVKIIFTVGKKTCIKK
jgi:hypothetical protein